jgi:hypothetical protein
MYIWGKTWPDPEMVKAAAKAHGIVPRKSWMEIEHGVSIYIDCESRESMLFPQIELLGMPYFVYKPLRELLAVKSMPAGIKEYKPEKTDKVICRRNCASDFSKMMALFESGKISKTAKAGKQLYAKILANCGWDDAVDKNGKFCAPKDAPRPDSFKITSAMHLLAKIGGLLASEKEWAESIATGPALDFLKKLLRSYCSLNLENEKTLLPGLRFEPDPYWSDARKDILERLPCLPVDKFISCEDFEKFIKRTANGFMHANLGSAKTVDYDGSLVVVDWNNYERRALRVFLCCFCAMGMVDLAFRECAHPVKKYEKIEPSIEVAGVRLTKLGASLLNDVEF